MWHTSQGIRTLEGAEADLFRRAIGCLVDECSLAEDFHDDFSLGIGVFDTLSYGQKLAMLDRVAQGLLVKSVKPPELTAVSEGTVGAVFRHLRHCVQVELDPPDGELWRSLIREVLLDIQRNEPWESPIPSSSCTELETWNFWLDLLEERILWDHDWDDGMVGMDVSPDQRACLKQMLDIPEDYYVIVAPDPRPEEISAMLERLNLLTR